MAHISYRDCLVHTFLLAVLGFAACNRTDRAVVATIDDQTIRVRDIRNYVSLMSPQIRTTLSIPDQKRRLIDRYIDNQVKVLLAKKEGLEANAEYVTLQNWLKTNPELESYKKEVARNGVLNSLLYEKITSALPSPTEKDILNYYASYKVGQPPEKIFLLSRIMCSEEPRVQIANKELHNGIPFSIVALHMSTDKMTASQGGRMHPILQSDLDPELQKDVSLLPIGTFTEVLKTGHGYEIYRKEREYIATYQDLRPRLKQLVQAWNFQQWVKRQAEKMHILIFEDVINRSDFSDEAS